MKIELPGEMDSKLVSKLRSAEWYRAIELIKAGKL
jgi:muconolactone delta-isomerase|tara:strand:- start:151 stop:255 length:105 start_codon:yes stop_codon:yes gene_type:complete